MNNSHQWIENIIFDLREYSADLLEQGLASGASVLKPSTLASPLQQSLKLVSIVCDQVPRLLNELESEEHCTVAEMVTSLVSRHAILSNRPSDYTSRNGQLVPYRWLRPELEQVLPADSLRWIRYIIQQTAVGLASHASRFEKQIEAARLCRDGDSKYAIIDRHQLEHMLSEVKRAELRLISIEHLLLHRAGRALSPSRYRPKPFPRSKTWLAFRRIADHILRPTNTLGDWLNALLSAPIPMADIPFLYQRWCGLQIIRSVERLGWETVGDVRGTLFLGGQITIKLDNKLVTLWVEPRISKRTSDLIGWSCVDKHNEVTPDFLFVCGQSGQRDAFVLDATLHTSPESLAAKEKYRNLLHGQDSVVVAGITIRRRPLRSWAIAPIRSQNCVLGDLGDPQGKTGTIPLNAENPSRSALDAWISDVLKHAEKS